MSAASDYTRRLTRRSGSSFFLAFLLLPRKRRQALYAVYAFCRLVDDAADEAATPEQARLALDRWRRELDLVYGDGPPSHAVSSELARAVRDFPIRRQDLEAVIEGCEWDVARSRYATWDELRGYCARVASAVGLACVAIFGADSPRGRAYATDLGIALQLTNILRDLDEDARRGRLYLPQQDLAAFAVDEARLLSGARDEAVLCLLRFQARRARAHYLRARALPTRDERRRLLPAEIMGDIYLALLDRIEEAGFPLERVALSGAEKALLVARRLLPL